MMADDSIRLFPAPRVLERTGGAFSGVGHDPDLALDTSLAPDAYVLRVGADGVEVRHGDGNGRRYGLDTLEQLVHAYGASLPGLVVEDAPDFPVRGYMLDVSRDRVPTRATLERIVGVLSRVRINHLQLYTEHTFAYREHEEVWRDASPMTAEDVQWLDELCADHGIELAANQNAFGHMQRWLKHDRYRPLAEAPEGWETSFGTTQAAGVLAPTDESLAFVQSLFDELLPNFRSRRVNVNCDETFELGRGRSRAEVERRGRGRVYLDYLRQLVRGLHARGKDVLFWGDILRAHPELLPEVPRTDCTALVWHYEGPTDPERLPAKLFDHLSDFGITRETMRGFVGHVPVFAESGFPFWVCPGTSSWNSLLGRLSNARANLLDAAEEGVRAGAGGYLITDWGDSGHLQPPSVSFPAIAYGAAVSWCAETNRDVDPSDFLSREIFEDSTGRLAAALREAGDLYAKTGVAPLNGSVLHYQLLGGGLGILARLMGSPTEDGLAAVVSDLNVLAESIGSADPQCADGEILRRELTAAIRLARHGAWRSAQQSGFSAPPNEDLRSDLADAIELQRVSWLERSRPGGLRESLGRLEGTLAEYDR